MREKEMIGLSLIGLKLEQPSDDGIKKPINYTALIFRAGQSLVFFLPISDNPKV
jgi:hypothetical protein